MSDYILEMKEITKLYPGVKALDNVNLQVERGEIHALVGENGAGKSTLMNVLSGTIPFGEYTGDIIYNGKECEFHSIHDSEEQGIVIIHQELALIPELTIAENMFLGNERANKFGKINWGETFGKAGEQMKRVGLKERPSVLIKDIGTGKQQLVEIAKALSKNVKLLILDEPTSSLNEEDSKMLLDMLLGFKKEGLTSIIITHKLNEVAYCADRITVLRDGSTIETMDNHDHNIDEDRIIKGMVGRELTDRYPSREHNVSNEVAFEARNWTVYHPVYTEKCMDKKVSFNVHKGEIVGFSGLQGAGRTELAMSLFGKSYGSNISGQEFIKGQEVKLKNEQDAIAHGLAYVTEDRKTNGLVLPDDCFSVLLHDASHFTFIRCQDPFNVNPISGLERQTGCLIYQIERFTYFVCDIAKHHNVLHEDLCDFAEDILQIAAAFCQIEHLISIDVRICQIV